MTARFGPEAEVRIFRKRSLHHQTNLHASEDCRITGGPDVVDNDPLDDPYFVPPEEFHVIAILLEILIHGELPLVFSGGTPQAVYVMLK
jgi:hypothetical protein